MVDGRFFIQPPNAWPMTILTLAELEAAINFWRTRSPSTGEEHALCAEAAALATPYAMMIFEHTSQLSESDLDQVAREALLAWRRGTEGTKY